MDELKHSYFQTLVVRQIMTEIDNELTREEKGDISDWIYEFFDKVVQGEIKLSKDLYKNISGINEKELIGYIEWRANILLQNLGLTKIFKCKVNPMRWIIAFDADHMNNTRTDFFEKRVVNYTKATDFDDL